MNNMKKKGFTLVEIIVSLGIFSIVATVALGALMKVISTNRKAQTLQSALTNLDFAIESISRELRTGSNIRCVPGEATIGFPFTRDTSNCSFVSDSNTSGAIVFETPKKSQIPGQTCNLVYGYLFLKEASGVINLKKAEQRDCSRNSFNSNSYIPMLSVDNITLTDYRVNITSGQNFPLATIYLAGYAGDREIDKTYFEVQTAVAPLIP